MVSVVALRSCKGDGGRPSEAALQGVASNRLKLHGLRALVVSVDGKRSRKTGSGEVQGDERKRTTDEVSKTSDDDVKTGRPSLLQDKSRGNLFTAWAASGIKVA